MEVRLILLYAGALICGSGLGYVARDAHFHELGIQKTSALSPVAGVPSNLAKAIDSFTQAPGKNTFSALEGGVADLIRDASDFDHVASLPPDLLNLIKPEWIEARCAGLSRDQLLAAFHQASMLQDPRLRDAILRACLHHLPSAEAWDLLANCPRNLQFDLSRDIAVKYGAEHGGLAVDAILRSLFLVGNLTQATDAFTSWSDKSPEAAAEWLGSKMRDTADPLSSQLVVQALQISTPAAAPELLKQVVDAVGRGDHRYDQSLHDLAYRWALADANQAFAWANSVQGDVLRERTLFNVGLAAANVNSDTVALKVADSLGSYTLRERIYSELAKSRAISNLASAKAWAATIPNPLLRAKVSEVLKPFTAAGK